MKWPLRKLRQYLTGINSQYVLKSCDEPIYNGLQKTGLYLHIPFCKSLCPYCPYNKVVWEKERAKQYNKALLREIELLAQQRSDLQIGSIYYGGGTPTICMDTIVDSLYSIRENFKSSGEVCIETSPNSCDSQVLDRLKDIGVNQLSIGVQSFKTHTLNYLGRSDAPQAVKEKVKEILAVNFDSVNIDMMFAIPGQTDSDLLDDLEQLLAMGASQVTLYPLFTFPYSNVTSYRTRQRVRKPSLMKRRRQFKLLADFFKKNNFARSSIWSFRRADVPRYSSATRENYIGLGCGAGSHVDWGFFLNTFDVDSYIERCSGGKWPTALSMKFTPQMHQFLWLYWRLYDTCVNEDSIAQVFGNDRKKLNRLLTTLRTTGWLKRKESSYILSDTGAFCIHLLQNDFILDYINTTWSACRKEPWPERIEL